METNNGFEGMPPCPDGPNSPPAPPAAPPHNYYLQLLFMSRDTHAQAAYQFRINRQFEKASYYQGKADAIAESINHYRELHGDGPVCMAPG